MGVVPAEVEAPQVGDKPIFGNEQHPELLTTKDGLILQPQPVMDDPLDPLNWPLWQKHVILAIVMALYFMFTYHATATVPSFPELQEQYNASVDMINWSLGIPSLGLASGPLIWSSFADIIGRRPIFIAGTLVALGASIGASAAPTYEGYMACRFFQGFGVSPAATVGLSIINDLFFEHERGQKIGFWVLALNLGTYFGLLIGGFMDLVSAVWISWLTAILFGAILVAEILFLPETLYPRRLMLARQAERTRPRGAQGEKPLGASSDATDSDVPRTKKISMFNVKPLAAMKHPKPWDSALRFLLLFKFVVIPAAVFIFCFGWYWWLVSALTLLPVAYVDYSPQVQGLFSLGFIIATLIVEVFCSGRLSDWIVIKIAKRNNGIKVAESRLWLSYPAAILTAVGLIVWGISIDMNYHWMVGQIAFALLGAGLQMGNTSVASYIVDCYPLQAMSIVTFYAVIINLSAFANPFYIAPWVASVGYTWSFAAQGIITVFFCIPTLGLLHWYGPKIRVWCGPPNWVNPEYAT